MKWTLAFAMALATVIGCGDGTTTVSPPAQESAAKGPMEYSSPDPKDAADEAENIKLLTTKQESSKADYQKNPKDEKLKKAYVDSTVALGLQYTYAESVDRSQKYKLAMKYLNEALELDPENPDAKSVRETIVNIYKSMGRPVPGESDKD